MARISTKHQVTIPIDVMKEFKFKLGDRLLLIEDNGKLVIRKA